MFLLLRLPSDSAQAASASTLTTAKHWWKQRGNKQQEADIMLADGRLLEYNRLLDYRRFNVDHSKPFPERKKKTNTKNNESYAWCQHEVDGVTNV